ncbi:unnamed protein product [Caenorhabditis angaria]|uniref:Uncharacterized protein n=1 Tax=Caenorhabditis angaria TaxID=860376 RepID=A0A9P1N640_9PELO|nr:unnamed protein product [Caenorhabditis angaria]
MRIFIYVYFLSLILIGVCHKGHDHNQRNHTRHGTVEIRVIKEGKIWKDEDKKCNELCPPMYKCVKVGNKYKCVYFPSCAGMKCEAGEECYETAIECALNPCPVEAKCRPWTLPPTPDYQLPDEIYRWIEE